MSYSPPPASKARPRRRRERPHGKTVTPWGWMFLTFLMYAATGLIMGALPAPYWIWNLALGGAIAQAFGLAGPQALRRFSWLRANGLMLLTVLGTLAITIALAIALGYVGTDNLDDIVLKPTAFEVIRMGLLAVLVGALGAIVGAATGDRLLVLFKRLETTLILAALSILGLGVGGFIGLLMGG